MFKRKRQKPYKGQKAASEDTAALSVPPDAPFVLVWESELRAIAAEALAWSVETGGDLFGRWHHGASMVLATKAGPRAQRNNAHFRLDVDYLRQLSSVLASDWALRYFGDWHSHHRLGLSGPSSGDRRRIRSVATKNQFSSMIEIIVTLEDSGNEPIVRIHPWIYELGNDMEPSPLRVKVLAGLSPVREALLKRRILPEQEFLAWEEAPLDRIRIGLDTAPPHLEAAQDADAATKERTFSHLAGSQTRRSHTFSTVNWETVANGVWAHGQLFGQRLRFAGGNPMPPARLGDIITQRSGGRHAGRMLNCCCRAFPPLCSVELCPTRRRSHGRGVLWPRYFFFRAFFRSGW